MKILLNEHYLYLFLNNSMIVIWKQTWTRKSSFSWSKCIKTKFFDWLYENRKS